MNSKFEEGSFDEQQPITTAGESAPEISELEAVEAEMAKAATQRDLARTANATYIIELQRRAADEDWTEERLAKALEHLGV